MKEIKKPVKPEPLKLKVRMEGGSNVGWYVLIFLVFIALIAPVIGQLFRNWL